MQTPTAICHLKQICTLWYAHIFFGYALGLGHCELLAQAVGNIFLSNVKISVQKAQQKNKSVRQRGGQKFAWLTHTGLGAASLTRVFIAIVNMYIQQSRAWLLAYVGFCSNNQHELPSCRRRRRFAIWSWFIHCGMCNFFLLCVWLKICIAVSKCFEDVFERCQVPRTKRAAPFGCRSYARNSHTQSSKICDHARWPRASSRNQKIWYITCHMVPKEEHRSYRVISRISSGMCEWVTYRGRISLAQCTSSTSLRLISASPGTPWCLLWWCVCRAAKAAALPSRRRCDSHISPVPG